MFDINERNKDYYNNDANKSMMINAQRNIPLYVPNNDYFKGGPSNLT